MESSQTMSPPTRKEGVMILLKAFETLLEWDVAPGGMAVAPPA
jgi:hypothetical protein